MKHIYIIVYINTKNLETDPYICLVYVLQL